MTDIMDRVDATPNIDHELIKRVGEQRTPTYKVRTPRKYGKKEAKAVHFAAVRLDKIKPGWADLVSLWRLDLSSTCNCVLGQVYGGYWHGLSKYNSNETPNGVMVFVSEHRYVRNAWKREVRVRR